MKAPPHPGLEYFGKLLRYDAWANGESLQSLRGGGAPEKAMRWMGHIVGSGTLWLARLRQEPQTMPVWPELDFDACAAGIARLADGWPEYLNRLGPEDLEESIGYRNTRGEYWTSSVPDILTHVTIHAAYHRAQIASALRESGREPASTDFIHAVRQGFVE
jgi:uncharacterized damage-inducible protein DinB